MDTSKPMKKETTSLNLANCIELDKEKITKSIESKGHFEEDGVKIKNWEGDKESEYYIANLKKGKYSYLGVLNVKLRRQDYGVNYYDNGDIYFGLFDSDIKTKHGAYFYAPTVKDGIVTSEVYHGAWTENQKDKRGMYVWLKEKEGAESFDTTDFDAYVGDIELDNYKRGVYLTKLANCFYVYYGSFDHDGRKNDEHAYFYDNSKDRVFCGKIVNDKFINGYLSSFDDENNLKNIIYVEFDKNDTPVKFLKIDEIEESQKESILEGVNKVRNFLLDDHFENVYNKVKEVKNYISNEMKDLNILDSEDGYPKIMNIGSSYNDIKVYSNLEKLMK